MLATVALYSPSARNARIGLELRRADAEKNVLENSDYESRASMNVFSE